MQFPTLTGFGKYVAIGIAVLALIAVIVLGVKSCKEDERTENNQFINSGITIEREASQREVINHVAEARDAVTNPTVNELNVVCDKYNRNC